jgi:hypothetical protein
MSSEYGQGPAPNSGQPRTDPTRGQATAETPVVPQPRAEDAPGAAYAGSGRTAGYQYATDYDSGGAVAAAGFTYLAATLMVLGGVLSLFTGIEAAIRGSFFVATTNYLYNINITGWGWGHIIIGALVLIAGCALFARQGWARWVAVFLAVVSAIFNFLFIPRYPFWALTVLAIDVFIIWALTARWQRRAY